MSNRTVVAVPVYKALFSQDDLLSLGLLKHVLGKSHEIKIFKPASLQVQVNDWATVDMPDETMSSRSAYSDLLLSKEFYESFADFDHVLIHQLDALVLKDTLQQWADLNLDYIGSIWVRSSIEKWENVVWDYVEEGVGNGGLSLRNVKNCIAVLNQAESLVQHQFRDLSNFSGGALIREFTHRFLDAKVFSENEDMFWGLVAETVNKNFKKGSTQQALEFGFEYDPDFCLRRLGHLPFGCHAWNRFPESRKFWSELLKEHFDVDALRKNVFIK